MRSVIRIVIMLLPAMIQAIEIQSPEPPSYLAMNYRAEWRMKPLAEVLEAIQKAIEKPIVASPAVQEILDKRRVTLVDDHKTPLRETFERLESTQELHFTAEPLRLRVESAGDILARRRRPVDLDLAEYGLFTVLEDFPAPELGLSLTVPSGALMSGAVGSQERQISEAQGVADWLKRIVDAGNIEVRGRTALQVMATPEEETTLRKALAEALALNIRRSTWRITWGIAKAGTPVPTGIVPVVEANRLTQTLDQRSSEVLHALAGQRVHGGRLQERSFISSIQIVSNQQDPVVNLLYTGRMADLRPLTGATLALLSYRLSWADPGNMAEVPITQGATIEPGNVSITVDKDGTGGKAQSSAPIPLPGSQVTVQLPSLWTWAPRGDVVLPQGTALILCAEHPLGHAVITLEEVH